MHVLPVCSTFLNTWRKFIQYICLFVENVKNNYNMLIVWRLIMVARTASLLNYFDNLKKVHTIHLFIRWKCQKQLYANSLNTYYGCTYCKSVKQFWLLEESSYHTFVYSWKMSKTIIWKAEIKKAGPEFSQTYIVEAEARVGSKSGLTN